MKIELGKNINLYPQSLIRRLKRCVTFRTDVQILEEDESNHLDFMLGACIEEAINFQLYLIKNREDFDRKLPEE